MGREGRSRRELPVPARQVPDIGAVDRQREPAVGRDPDRDVAHRERLAADMGAIGEMGVKDGERPGRVPVRGREGSWVALGLRRAHEAEEERA